MYKKGNLFHKCILYYRKCHNILYSKCNPFQLDSSILHSEPFYGQFYLDRGSSRNRMIFLDTDRIRIHNLDPSFIAFVNRWIKLILKRFSLNNKILPHTD